MNRLLRRAAGSLLFFFAGTAAAQSPAAARPHQFFAEPPAVTRAANAPSVKSQATPVRFNAASMKSLRHLDEFDVKLPNGVVHTAVLDLSTDHGGGIVSMVGRLKDRGNHFRVIITTGPGGSYGVIDTPEGSFRIVPGGDHDWLVDMSQEEKHIPIPEAENDGILVDATAKAIVIDPSRAALGTAITGVNTVADTKVLPSPLATIDMMFVITRGLANRLGGTLATRLNFLVTRANTSYADSEIAIILRMVYFTVVDYPDNTSDSASLNAITPGFASFNATVFGGIEALRTQYGADMVSLMRDGDSFGGSGVAWVPSTPTAGLMYSAMQGCVAGCESVWIHEVGHNMGNHHDRATATWQGWKLIGGVGPGYTNTYDPAGASFGYAFCKPSGALTCNPNLAPSVAGACTSTQPECALVAPATTRDPSNFSDIMSYFHATTTRIYKFSNSSATVSCIAPGGDGVARPCGIAEGPSNSADTATSMNNNRIAISGLKTTTVNNLPGAVQFAASGFSAPEASGAMTFTVSRVGGSSGAISVQYAVTGGTATVGADFTATSGTLNWAAGETADKTFTVPIINDAITEGTESLTATLSNPAGTTGVYLGFPSSVVGLILENFGGTAGGALPTGFTSTDWAVANDQAFDGTTSLRSAQAVSSGACCTGPAVNSDLTYTANIPAGTIAFAYRVSSYQGYGNFEFSVDGTTVLSASGETGWRLFFYPLATGGNHTLRWRYANQLTVRCNTIASPAAAEGGAACADRVWIDSVSLPGVAPVQFALNVSKTGTGLGTVTSAPAGINCDPTCSASFDSGTVVTLTAAPTVGSVFGGWSGNCSGTGTCQVTLSGAAAVTATFSASAATPTGSPSPASVDFGGQSMQTTSVTIPLTLTNIGAGTLTIASVSASPAVFVQTNNCAALALSVSCTINLTFTPTAQGAVAGNLAIVTSGGTINVPLAGNGERSLVTHYYRAILNRTPDASGKAFWEGEFARLGALGSNPNESWFLMANYFFNSPEYISANKTNTAFMIDVYNTFFNRPPDQGGFDFWMSQMNAGLSREGVIFWFMFSNEFRTFTQGIFGSTAARPEVDMVMDFFRGILNRFPDTPAFNAFVGNLRSAQCQAPAQRAGAVYTAANDISYFFLFGSAEYANRARTNTQFVSDMYNAFLRRGGTATEVAFWINQLTTGAKDRNTVRADFIASPEFAAKVNAVIAAGCVP